MSLSRESFRQWLLNHDGYVVVGKKFDATCCTIHCWLESETEPFAAAPLTFIVDPRRVWYAPGVNVLEPLVDLSESWAGEFIYYSDRCRSADYDSLTAIEALDVLDTISDGLPEPDWSPIEQLGGVE